MNRPRAGQVAIVFLDAFAPFLTSLARFLANLMLRLGALSLACLALLELVTASPASLESTIAKSRQIEANFHTGAAFVDSFRAQHGRLPDDDEFRAWAQSQSNSARWLSTMRIESGYPNSEAISHFGQTPKGGYLLVIWRGEWEEYYASWTGATSLTFNPSDYYLLGSPWADAALFAVAAALFGKASSYFRHSPDTNALPRVDPRGQALA